MKTVQLTGVTADSISETAVGDYVTEKVRMYCLEVLPPATWTSGLIQIGEPTDHEGENNRPRFTTLQRAGEHWVCTGTRERGERVELLQLPYIYRLFYRFKGIDPDRPGGAWWYRDFRTAGEREEYRADLAGFTAETVERSGRLPPLDPMNIAP